MTQPYPRTSNPQPRDSMMKKALSGPGKILRGETPLPVLILILLSCVPTYLLTGMILLIPWMFDQPMMTVYYHFGQEIQHMTFLMIAALVICCGINLLAIAMPGFLPTKPKKS